MSQDKPKAKSAQPQQFEEPPASKVRQPTPVEDSAALPSFEPPREGVYEEAEVDMEARSLTGFDSRLLSIKRAIEDQLAGNVGQGVVQADGAYTGARNIVGVALGIAGPDQGLSQISGAPGSPSLTLYVVDKTDQEGARRALVDSMGIMAASSDDVPVNVVVTGIIDAQPHRFRIRAAPGGVSVGHYRITAGTLGCLAFGRQAPRNNRILILSNNHVLANVNSGVFGDCVIQPGAADFGVCPQDQVAILEQFVPINLTGGTNYVDCATAWAWPDRVRKELIYLSGGVQQFFNVSNSPIAPYLGMPVGKSGRTTQLTSGTVTGLSVTVNVNYPGFGTGLFKDQIAITGPGTAFSAGGDSGSLIWTWDSSRRPVGLLFAGGGNTTFANKIGAVLNALDIYLYT
jgi:hypothetical protein